MYGMNLINFAHAAADGANDDKTIEVLGAVVGIFIFSVFVLALVTTLVLWVIALVHLIRNDDVKDRTLWLVLLFVVGAIIGPIYYFAVQKPYEKAKQKPKANPKK